MTTQLNDTKLNYRVHGDGPAVIWLHGFMEDLSIWEDIITTIPNKKHVCIDLLGHGRSVTVDQVHDMPLQALAVKSILQELNIQEFAIVGHSMGGYVGLQLLDELSNQCTHFVLFNSTSQADSKDKKLNRERAIKIVDQQKDSYARMGVINLFSSENRSAFAEEIEDLIKVAQNTTAEGIKAALSGMKVRDSKEKVLKKYKGQKLIISGIEDPVLLSENSRKEAEKTNSIFVQVDGGHMSYLEAKDQVIEVLNDFLEV